MRDSIGVDAETKKEKALIEHLVIKNEKPDDLLFYLGREWLCSNGLGGYASGTVLGVNTRRDHGTFVPYIGPPCGRYMMANHVTEEVSFGEKTHSLSGFEFKDGSISSEANKHIREFRLEYMVPVWIYDVGGAQLEKAVLMPTHRNATAIRYRLISGNPLELILKPYLSEQACHNISEDSEILDSIDNSTRGIEIRVQNFDHKLGYSIFGKDFKFTLKGEWVKDVYYRIEYERGSESVDVLFNPGQFKIELSQGQAATLFIGMDSFQEGDFEEFLAQNRQRLEKYTQINQEDLSGMIKNLSIASDQFLFHREINPDGNPKDHSQSIIAGYHWFMDWGRDSMISLEGLAICTKRYQVARDILNTLSKYVGSGLLFNSFSEGSNRPSYNCADSSLWFFHALERYYRATNDKKTLEGLLPLASSFLDSYINGTATGIKVDPEDGLVSVFSKTHPLTWMDAQFHGLVFTPRNGKPVEIQALWFNALKLISKWTHGSGNKEWAVLADKVRDSFNKKFWFEEEDYLFDLLDKNGSGDKSLRPNQIFAISLDFPLLDRKRWIPVLEAVEKKLLTPYGLRSLAPGSPAYRPHYKGNRYDRDAAYHQGAVWPWLIGHFIDAWLKAGLDKEKAKGFLTKFKQHLTEAGVGSISEIFDGDSPHVSRGCISQAWSVAEILRSAVNLEKTNGHSDKQRR